MLSDRIRPDVEAAPWVVEEIKRLEAENAKLREVLERAAKSLESRCAFGEADVARAALWGTK